LTISTKIQNVFQLRWKKMALLVFLNGTCVGKKPNVPFVRLVFTLSDNGSLCKNPVLKIYFVKNTILRLFAER